MSEEDVKIKFLIPFLAARGYEATCTDFNVPIDVQEGRKKRTIFADALVYTSAKKQAPLLLVETKAEGEPLDRSAREQAISYARLLPQIAPLVLLTNGSQVHVYHTLHKTRIPELPSRGDLDHDLLKFVLSPAVQEALRLEAKHDLFIIDDVRTFKTILNSCHNEIRNNEGLDPTAAFDEMSKVMFCKLYEERRNPQGNRFRTSVFDSTMKDLKVNIVRTIYSEAKVAKGYSEILDAKSEILLKDRTIRRIVELFEAYDLGLTAFDVKGEAFEFFLGDTFTGGLGEYFTPRNVVEFMVDAIEPKIGEKIIDPFCGTGGFLIYAFETVGEKIRLQEFSAEEKARWREELSSRSLYGTDWKERTSQACKMNMMVHGDGSAGIYMHDGLTDVAGVIEEGAFDLCLTNPPFGSHETDADVLKRYEVAQGRKSLDRVVLAVERCIRLSKPGGRIAIVLIDGVLNNPSSQYVRDYIRSHSRVLGIVSLAQATFQGYGAGAKTSVLFLERKPEMDDGRQDQVFMAIAGNTGLAPNGAAIAGNVLPEILLDFRAFLRREVGAPRLSNSANVTLQDRMDVEYYFGESAEKIDLTTARTRVEQSLQRVSEYYSAIAEAEKRFKQMKVRESLLGDVLEEVSDPVTVEPNSTYRLLGVRWWGDGAFIKDGKLGSQCKGRLYQVKAGTLLYNRLFAAKGSFAFLAPEHEGCCVSNEFPSFRGKESLKHPELVTRYIVHCLNSPQYLSIIDAQSTGSTKTSRNRFNQKALLKLNVLIPEDPADLLAAVEAMDRVIALRSEAESVVESVKSLRGGLLQSLPSCPAGASPASAAAAPAVRDSEPSAVKGAPKAVRRPRRRRSPGS